MSLCLSSSFIVCNLTIPSMAAVFSLLLVIVHLLYILIVDICSMAIVCSLLLVVVHLLYISIVNIYSMATVSTCKYCWQQVRRCDYEEHIGRSCPDLPLQCVFECGYDLNQPQIANMQACMNYAGIIFKIISCKKN